MTGKPYGRGARVAGEAYGEKIIRGGYDNTELARTSTGPPPPPVICFTYVMQSGKACDSKSHAT